VSRISVAVLLIGALALGACTAPTSRPSTGPAPSGTQAGGVTLTAYTDNDGPTVTVLLTGKIGDHGMGRSVNPDGSANAEHTGLLELDLSQGTFRIDVGELDRRFVATMASFPPDRSSCSGTASASSAAPIVGGSGTGAYRGITGTFTLTIAVTEVDVRPTCGGLVAQLVVITGSASVTYAS
jgi:hypothetical protein